MKKSCRDDRQLFFIWRVVALQPHRVSCYNGYSLFLKQNDRKKASDIASFYRKWQGQKKGTIIIMHLEGKLLQIRGILFLMKDRSLNMSAYLTYDEILLKCQEINHKYEINQDRFDEIVDYILDEESTTADQKIQKAFPLLLQAVSDEIQAMEKTVDLQPACRMGCAFCCYFPIVINKMEANLIKNAIDRMKPDRKQFIQKHLLRYFQQYKEPVKELGNLDIVNHPDAKRVYKEANLPCPFLNPETNACLIYEVRPLPCRSYVNYTDPDVCAKNAMPKETISYEFLYQEYMGALNELLHYLYENDEIKNIDYPGDLYQEDMLINWMQASIQ